ncbi:hypothetical protein ACP4OV_003685 [Aristida adscensionis]
MSLRAAQALASRSRLLSVRPIHGASADAPAAAGAARGCAPPVPPLPSWRTVPTGVAGAEPFPPAFAALAAVEARAKERSPPNLLPQSVVLYQYQARTICDEVGGFTSDGNFSRWCHKFVSTLASVLIGQAAILLGLSNSSAFAQEDSVSRADTASEQAEGNATGLQRIEDGSVISNEHTVKWRIFTDNARDFFMKAIRQLNEAEKLFQAALHEAKVGFGPRDPHVASALNNLAEFYRLRQDYNKAELLYLEAIEILEESFGSDDIRVGTALHSLGICYYLQRKLTQAQICFEDALKIEGRVLGVGNPEYANTMYLLAKGHLIVLSLQGNGKDAVSLFEESIRILEEAGLGESPSCIQKMSSLAKELIELKRVAEAENWDRKILHHLELLKGWDSLQTVAAAESLSFTLQALGELKEAEELLERCLAARKKILHEDHFWVARTLVHLARLSLVKFLADIKVNDDLARSDLARGKQAIDRSIRITEGMLNSTVDMKKIEKMAATGVLLQALEIFGLLEVAVKYMLPPGEQDFRPIVKALDKCVSLYKEPDTRSIVSKNGKREYLTCLRRLMDIAQNDLAAPQTMVLQELLRDAKQIIEELGGESNS